MAKDKNQTDDSRDEAGTAMRDVPVAIREGADRVATVLAEAIRPPHGTATQPTAILLQPRGILDPDARALWEGIRYHTDQISFRRFHDDFVCRVLPADGWYKGMYGRKQELLAETPGERQPTFVPGSDLYELLRTAAEVFLLLNSGMYLKTGEERDVLASGDSQFNQVALKDRLSTFLGQDRSSYIATIMRGLDVEREASTESPFCAVRIGMAPCLLELIWSYWMEEGMLVQTTNAIALRFQNVRRGNGVDPLADMTLDPLRPLSAFLWGYIQDEPHRLTIARRAYEYSHQYGLTLFGKAVPRLRPADARSKFLEAFHELLRYCATFYRDAADTTVAPDPFPLLVALKDLHLVLSEGAHNQFRDLPWTARVEMLVQQWLLGRDEIRDFLRGRPMVSYPERWMGAVDAMKRLQGWNDVSPIHFRDLAVFGERLLLSVRHIAWNEVAEPEAAGDWALFWRPEIQGYIHAYRMATGVSLSDDMVDVRNVGDTRYRQPAFHLRNRLVAQRRQQRLTP